MEGLKVTGCFKKVKANIKQRLFVLHLLEKEQLRANAQAHPNRQKSY